MRERYRRQVERLGRVSAAVTGNARRMAEQARKTLISSGVIDYLERNRRQLDQMQGLAARLARSEHLEQLDRLRRQTENALRPAHLEQLERLRRQTEQLLRPEVLDIGRQRSAVEKVLSGYTRVAEDLGRQLEGLLRPSYFGALERLSRQAELVRPRQLEGLGELVAQIQEVVRPRHLEAIGEAVRRLQELPGSSLAASLRQRLAGARDSYAAWLERNWAQIYADPDRPPPVMFLLASLPMAVGLPLLRAVKIDDEPLLVRLEAALCDGPLLDQLQAAVQATPELDAIAKRHLVRALESLRDGHYIDAAPPLYHGLERAFRGVARRHGVIDGRNHFLIKARRRKARSIEDVFEHLDLDPAYLRFLHAWVFGETGNLARHADLPDEPAHRRWVLRAVAALVGWFEYCAGDATPMGELVQRLELPPVDADAAASGE